MNKRNLQTKRALRSVLLVLLLSAVGMTKAFATYDFSAVCETGQTLYYNIFDDVDHLVELTYPGTVGNYWWGYDQPSGSLILPEEVEYNGVTYTLTMIGGYAFYDCTGLTSIGIPNSVTIIGEGAFVYCSGLTWISLPDSITYISSYAFDNCTGLTSFYIPDSVTTIGEGAFYDCTSLVSIYIPNSVTSIGVMAFGFCIGLTSIEIPNSVTSIGERAFEDCRGLTSIEIPTSVTYMGSNPFQGCRSLEQIIVASNNAYYDSRENCNAIIETNTNVLVTGCRNTVIPNSVTSIGEAAFYDCTDLTSIEIPYSVTSIGIVAFYSCNNLASIVIPNSVTSIGEGAFEYCSGLTELDLGNSVASIGGYAFYYCPGLTSIELPNSLSSLGSFAFYGCNGLTSIEIPSSVNFIETNPFASCSGLEQIIVAADNAYYDSRENSNTIISTNTNVLVTGCRNTVIPNSVISIGNCAFYGCNNLVSIEIPNAVTSIGSSAFNQCSRLTSVTLGDSLTTIGNYAFRECTKLTSVTIGNSIASIGDWAFYGCHRLSAMTVLAEAVPSIGMFAFDNVPTTIPIYVPCNVVENYQAANGWRRFTNFIGLCSGCVSVTVNPSEGGTTTGAGYYNSGDVCVLTATANPGFVFANWMENGRVISMESVCSIYAHPTTVVANFCLSGFIDFEDANVKALCVANWDINGDGELSYAEATAVTDLGQVFRYNSTITSFNELQYFISLTSIGGSAFYGCNNLTSIVLPNSVNAIYSYVFYNCNNLTSIEIPNSVLSIGSNAFYNCTSLNSVNIGGFVTSIGEDAFRNCSSLTSIEIPSSVTNIVTNPFAGCRGLEQIMVDSGNTVYDSRENSNAIINTSTNALVAGCKNTVIPNTVTSIGNYAFYGCNGLTSIEIPDSVTSIGDYAFYGCVGMNSVTIGNSVTSIGALAFYHCIALTSVAMGNAVTSIGSNAFMDCTGLVSIEISNSVTSIGVLAFYGCSGISSITVLAETPPAVGGYAFYRINKTIPVYVLCGSLEAYQNVVGWNEFTNYNEICSSEITATAHPNEGGSVSGAGTYDFGTTITLTATANENYIFVNWTENGEVVSSEPAYTFTVTGDRNLVANFGEITNFWTPNVEDYEDNMTFTCVVEIDGEEQRSTMLEVGAFCGEECRGSQRATYFAPTDRYIIQMTVFGESNDMISFRLYDHQLQQELLLSPPADVTFNTNGYGSLSNPYVLNFTSTITHTQALNSGWNWWSTYIELNNNDGLSQLENSIGSAGILIKSRNSGYVEAYEYNGETNWYGTLSSINNEQMYKIRTNAECNAIVEGWLANPSDHPITINNGWNWIGFPCNQNVGVDEAMSGFTPENNDIIKSRNGYSTYYSDGNYNMWYGTLNTLEPGKGYMYRSNSATQKTLVFTAGRGDGYEDNITPENNVFRPTDGDFADNMTLTAVVEMDGEELRSEDYELAAFVGDECRGSVRLMYVEPIDRYIAFLTIFGEQDEELYFQLTDGIAGSLASDQMAFAADDIIGTLDNPFVMHFGILDVDESALANVKVYPNPSEGIFNIEGQNIRKVEVFNAFGQSVYSKETENGFMKLDLTSRAAGIYLIRIVTNEGILNHQIIKK